MDERLSRSELLLGAAALEKLASCRVAVFGLGGVGSYAAEALARAGVGALDLVDSDRVTRSNINRQLYALESTVGRLKTDVARERVLDINPSCRVTVHPVFFLPDTRAQFDFSRYDYVVDAIDTVTAKLLLIECSKAAGVPIICAMGAGNKLDPTRFEVADLAKTSVDPLAKVLRKECSKRGIKGVKVVYSKEEPISLSSADGGAGEAFDAPACAAAPFGPSHSRRSTPGSVSWVPSVCGLILAGEVVKDLI